MVVRRAIPGLLALVIALAAAVSAQARVDVPADQPNIVLIYADDQDGSYETISKMPYLASRTGWYRFTNAFINNPTCCPSRATLLTGRWSHHTGVEGTGGAPPYDDSDTIATRLRGAGYTTGWFGKYHLGSSVATPPLSPTYVPPGWDDFVDHKASIEGGSGPYYDYTLNDNGTLIEHGSAPEDYSVDVLADELIEFIETAAAAERPFFSIFASRAPHNSWTAAPRHLGTYADEPVTYPPSWNEDTSDKPAWWAARPDQNPGNRAGAMRKQWDTLLAVDDAISRIQHRLQNLGLISNTVILYMSDNGYSFGEHRWGQKRCIYDSCTKTPLLVKFGSQSQGTVFPWIVGNEDLAPTFAAIAGASPPEPSDGQSFYDMLRYKVPPPDWQDEALLRASNPLDDPGHPPHAFAVRTPTHMYAETINTGEVELYDMIADPYQLENLAAIPELDVVEAELAARLAYLRSLP